MIKGKTEGLYNTRLQT